MRRALALLAIAACFAFAAPAEAQPTPNAEAARHFREGKRLRDEGRCAEAATELRASLAIEPSIGAHYNLGVCSEKLDKKRDALLHYNGALELAKDRKDDREREIRAQREEFLERTPHLRLALPHPLPPGLRIVVEGEPVPVEDLQTETRFFPARDDRASYTIVATAVGHEETRLQVAGDALRRHDLVQVVLRPAEAAAARAPTSSPAGDAGSGGWSTQAWLGAGLFAAGAVAAGVDVLLYANHRSRLDELERRVADERNACAVDAAGGPQEPCNTAAITRYNSDTTDENTRAWVVVGGVGAVAFALLVSGAVVYLGAPKASKAPASASSTGLRVVPQVGPTQRGLTVVGTF